MLPYSETSQKRRKYSRGNCEIKATSPLPPFKGGKAKSGWWFHPFDVIKSSAFRKEGGVFCCVMIWFFGGENFMVSFTLEYWLDNDWYVGKLRELPSCFSQGETLQELEENIKDVYLMLLEDEMPLPANAKTKMLQLAA